MVVVVIMMMMRMDLWQRLQLNFEKQTAKNIYCCLLYDVKNDDYGDDDDDDDDDA